MKKNLKIAKSNNKGITLIALVVTIVVLLILAAITITAVMSEGGIFKTAKRAQNVQEETAIREKIQIMLADAQLEKLVNNTTLKSYLEGKGYSVTEDTTAGTVTIPVDGYNVTVDLNTYEITEMEKIEGSGSGSENEGQEPDEPENSTVAVTGVTLNQNTAAMTVGENLTLTATVSPDTATNKQVTWTSSVPAVASVTDGVINALTAGTTKITVTTVDGNFSAECNITVNDLVVDSVADMIGVSKSTNTYTVDKYGNKIVIPAGFKVLANENQGVVYDYDLDENGVPTGEPVVQDGIVIQHETDLNEFVWVPVGEIKNDAVENTTNKIEIQLGRYEDFTMTETTPPMPPQPKQKASRTEYDNTTSNDLIEYELEGNSSFFENSLGKYNNKTYKSIANFETLGSWINNTLSNGGYYIARYEASYGENGEADSKPSTGTPIPTGMGNYEIEKTEGQLWNWVYVGDASIAAKAMYPYAEGVNYYSDLVNSYAWDTAIIFIQTYSEKTTYASLESLHKDNDTTTAYPANTGERDETATIGPKTTDKECNIYDIASNLCEWTTETCWFLYADISHVSRGGGYYNSNTTYSRYRRSDGECSTTIGFRTVLDCKAEV